jgi:O-antigen/teichoic acid export membrane protein
MSGSEAVETIERPVAPITAPPHRRPAMPAGLRMFVRTLGPTGFALGLQFVTFAVTARGLGVGAFGLYAAVTAAAAILVEVLGCGISDVLVRAVARDPASFARYFGLMLVAFAVTLVPAVALGAGLLAWASDLELPLVVIVVGLTGEMIAGRFSASAELILVAHGSPAGAAVVRVVTVVTRLLSALAFFAVAHALGAWVWVVLAQSCLLALGLMLFLVRRYGAPRFGWSWPELRSGLAFAVNQTARALQSNVDRLVLARYADPVVLGAYAAGARLLVVGLFPIQVLTRILYPEFFRQGERGIAAARQYGWSRVPAMLATGIASFVAVAVVAQILPQVLGHTFVASRNAAILLAAALPLIGLQYLAADILTGAGYQAVRAVLAIGTSCVFGALMVLGERMIGGISGVIIAFVAGHALFLAILVLAALMVGRAART